MPAITGSYFEQGTSVTGTGSANTTINVYIDKALLGTVTSDGSGNWTLSGLSSARYDLYAGGSLTATAGTACSASENAHSSAKIVQCNPDNPSTSGAVSAPVAVTCENGTVVVEVASQSGLYTHFAMMLTLPI